jgi:signal recognition particle GTPase
MSMIGEVHPETDFQKYEQAAKAGTIEAPIDTGAESVQQTEVAEPASTDAKPVEGGEVEATAEATDADDDHDEEAGEDKRPARRGGWKRQIERLKAQVAELQARNTGGADGAGQTEAVPQIVGEPKLSDFDGDLDAYIPARVKWEREQERVQEEFKAKSQSWQTRTAEAAAKYEDWEDYSDVALPLTADMRDFLIESEVGPQIGYHLAKDLQNAQRIQGLPPLQRVKELTKLELAISGTMTNPDKPKPAVSKAPVPPKQIAGKSPTMAKNEPPMDFSEYEKWRKAGGKV